LHARKWLVTLCHHNNKNDHGRHCATNSYPQPIRAHITTVIIIVIIDKCEWQKGQIATTWGHSGTYFLYESKLGQPPSISQQHQQKWLMPQYLANSAVSPWTSRILHSMCGCRYKTKPAYLTTKKSDNNNIYKLPWRQAVS
jgi:hypothetical protein